MSAHTSRIGLYIMVILILVTTCSIHDDVRRISAAVCGSLIEEEIDVNCPRPVSAKP